MLCRWGFLCSVIMCFVLTSAPRTCQLRVRGAAPVRSGGEGCTDLGVTSIARRAFHGTEGRHIHQVSSEKGCGLRGCQAHSNTTNLSTDTHCTLAQVSRTFDHSTPCFCYFGQCWGRQRWGLPRSYYLKDLGYGVGVRGTLSHTNSN